MRHLRPPCRRFPTFVAAAYVTLPLSLSVFNAIYLIIHFVIFLFLLKYLGKQCLPCLSGPCRHPPPPPQLCVIIYIGISLVINELYDQNTISFRSFNTKCRPGRVQFIEVFHQLETKNQSEGRRKLRRSHGKCGETEVLSGFSQCRPVLASYGRFTHPAGVAEQKFLATQNKIQDTVEENLEKIIGTKSFCSMLSICVCTCSKQKCT
ncbi:unnamed protein product [Bemisia tabaci]|uniref:Uncharacterized protein n=1 Tax=Bemisia tabaci TaxID=7038 RepID=A0A9P0AE48_BEMTA|nr:unnamed protein product [Bemisia tabaci]